MSGRAPVRRQAWASRNRRSGAVHLVGPAQVAGVPGTGDHHQPGAARQPGTQGLGPGHGDGGVLVTMEDDGRRGDLPEAVAQVLAVHEAAVGEGEVSGGRAAHLSYHGAGSTPSPKMMAATSSCTPGRPVGQPLVVHGVVGRDVLGQLHPGLGVDEGQARPPGTGLAGRPAAR